MLIEIKKCNNIENGIIEIKDGKLNIKYAINGTGKSTIANAISIVAEGGTDAGKKLNQLTSFKHIGIPDQTPEVLGLSSITNIKVFNEKYINEVVFQPNELLKNSFDIFIRDENYEKGMNAINELIEKMKTMFAEEKDIETLIQDFNEISGSFGKPTLKGIHGSSSMGKAFKDGNRVVNIPAGLEEFKNYIQHPENYKWIDWQLKGKSYIDISDDCPYCTNDIKNKKEKILKVSATYDSKSIENLNKIIATFERLNKYFSNATKTAIDNFVKNIDGFDDDQIAVLKEIKEQIDRLNDKFKAAKNFGFSSLKDVGKVIDGLKAHKIDITLYNHLTSEETKAKIEIVNNSIDELILKAGELQGSVAKQNILIARLVKENSDEINVFLKSAGYRYRVTLQEDETGQHKLRLIHDDIHEALNEVKTHLSFGERNAFSLVLFMYDALKSKSNLIILDDPISSFDKNKKYAIIEMLFTKPKSFRGKTVLLLTHDLDPIVDMVNHHGDRFEKPYATFLENKHGVLSEKEITRSNIKTFAVINDDNARSDSHAITKLVYLRRLLELSNEKDITFEVISNLFHKRDIPKRRVIIDAIAGFDQSICECDMTQMEIDEGCNKIKKYIPDFNYSNLINLVKNKAEMIQLYLTTNNNYEKLHLYRIIFDGEVLNESNTVKKFINEAFHIENNYIYQLDPHHFQLVPQYIIDECDIYIANLQLELA
jgi:wobble nucleotide-excising tRNase